MRLYAKEWVMEGWALIYFSSMIGWELKIDPPTTDWVLSLATSPVGYPPTSSTKQLLQSSTQTSTLSLNNSNISGKEKLTPSG